MRRIIVIGVLVVIVLLLIAQFGPSPVRGETVRQASPSFVIASPMRRVSTSCGGFSAMVLILLEAGAG
jgi:hypothetical protein